MRIDDITIVVPTKDESENIGGFLASLPPEVHLVVVDASSDDTPEKVVRLRPERTQVLRYPGNISEARQKGAEVARTSWLLFTDADISFEASYFDRLARMPVGPGAGGIVGTKQSLDSYRRYHALFLHGQRLLTRLGIPAATGSNMLIRRDVLLEVGGFDLRLVCNEDSEVMWRVARAEHDVLFAADLVVYERDHRRLDGGVVRKLVHSVLRCAVLYTGLLPQRWWSGDWGYWRERPAPEQTG